MKKVLLFILLLCPILVNAKSVIPGGENIGIYLKDSGVTVIGFYKVNGIYEKGSLLVGDRIIKVNDQNVETIDELVDTINKEIDNDQIDITFLRGNTEYVTTLNLEKVDGVYKTGLYVKDSTTGIGTLTYIDPETMTYASLGHEVVDSSTKERIEIKKGYTFKSVVTSIKKSVDGNPGGKYARFDQKDIYGSVDKNTTVGIYGKYEKELPNKDLIEVASMNDIHLGKATILTTLKDNKVKSYEINIKEINESSKIKNFYFEITDKKLLKECGGIVQGMSGSPIIQDNKLIGAVTHVITDNVKTGYGIYIETMLNEGNS